MTMNANKREHLESIGFKVGSVKEFLELTPEESALIEVRLVLSNALKQRRTAKHISQTALAAILKSSQSRVAKMEAGDSSVSIDLLIHALLMAGVSREQLGELIANG